MHKESRLIVFLGVLILVVSIVSTIWFFTSQGRENLDYRSRAASLSSDVFLESFDGTTVIEAEHFNEKLDRGGKSWTVGSNTTTDSGFSNGGYITALPDTGSLLNTNFTATSPQANYRIRFAKTGIHYVWVRAFGPQDTSDSLHIGLNNQLAPDADRLGVVIMRTDWNFDTGASQGFSRKTGTWRVVSDSSSGHSSPNIYQAYRSSSTDSSEYQSTAYAPYGANVSLEGKVKLTNNLSTTQAYITVRSNSGASTYYALGIKNGNKLELVKKVSGTWTTIRTVSIPTVVLNTWYTLKLTASGSTLTGYLNGVQKVQATDTQIASGSYIGLRTRYGTVSIDDLVIALVPNAPISKWVWNRQTMDKDNAGRYVLAQINVPTAGDHTLNVWMREDGTLVDKIILTTNANYPTPSGLGPVESVRTTSTGLGSLGLGSLSVPCTDSLCTGLQGYWNMNETYSSGPIYWANATGGSVLHDGQALGGYVTNCASSICYAKIGKAAYFDYDYWNTLGRVYPPYLFIPGDQSPPPRGSGGAFTIAGWFNLINTGGEQYHISPLARGGGYDVVVYRDALNFLKGIKFSVNGTTITSTTNLSFQTWYFFAVTYDGSTAKIYLNQTEVASGAVPQAASSPSFSVGGEEGCPTCGTPYRGTGGFIDELGFWNIALDSQKLTTRLYNGGNGLTYPFDGTVLPTSTPGPTATLVPTWTPSVSPTPTLGRPPQPTVSSCIPIVVEHLPAPRPPETVQYVILRCTGSTCSGINPVYSEIGRTAELTYTDPDTQIGTRYYYKYYVANTSGVRISPDSYSVYVTPTTVCGSPTSTPTPTPTNTPIPTFTPIPTNTPVPQILSCNTHRLFNLTTWYSRDASTWQQPYTDTPIASVQRGGQYLYEIVYKNNSAGTLGSGVVLKDTLPSQLVYDGRAVYCGAVPPATCQIFDCSRTSNADGSTNVTCFAGVYMTPGYIMPERFFVKVKVDAPLGNFTNTAFLQYPYPPTFTSDTCSNTTTVIQ